MDVARYVALFVCEFLVLWFLVVVIHEAGHATTAWLMRVPVQRICLGDGWLLRRFVILRTIVEIRWIPNGAAVEMEFVTAKWTDIFISAAGPIASLSTGAIAWMFTDASRDLIKTFAYISLVVGIINLIPIRNTDGAWILKRLREKAV